MGRMDKVSFANLLVGLKTTLHGFNSVLKTVDLPVRDERLENIEE